MRRAMRELPPSSKKLSWTVTRSCPSDSRQMFRIDLGDLLLVKAASPFPASARRRDRAECGARDAFRRRITGAGARSFLLATGIDPAALPLEGVRRQRHPVPPLVAREGLPVYADAGQPELPERVQDERRVRPRRLGDGAWRRERCGPGCAHGCWLTSTLKVYPGPTSSSTLRGSFISSWRQSAKRTVWRRCLAQ